MAVYNLLRDGAVHIVFGGNRYNVKVTPDLSFNQTFAEEAYSVKTLHDQTKMFQGTSITKANPADFNFAVHLTKEKDESIVLDLLTDYESNSGGEQLKSFDIYFVTAESTFKVEGCILTDGEFTLNKSEPLTLTVNGKGKKLTRVGNASFSIPGNLQSPSATRTPVRALLDVEVGGSDVTNLVTATLSVQNNINWTPYETLQNSLSVTDASNAMYPTSYTINDRVVSGNITQFLTSDNSSTFQTFNTNTSVAVKTLDSGSTFFNANLSNCMFTKRTEANEIFTQTFDYRLVTSPADLGSIITY
tara:strand:- start:1479 stop:2387 length:909 start_codon:yes stop_codon:yes gene_type:complete